MAQSNRQLLSTGVFFIIIVIAILLYAATLIPWTFILPVILVLGGCWTIVIAAQRSTKPQKYERSAFGTAALGAILIALGGAWYLVGINIIFAVALILLVLGALAIAAASKRT
jgi:hypothetical protein